MLAYLIYFFILYNYIRRDDRYYSSLAEYHSLPAKDTNLQRCRQHELVIYLCRNTLIINYLWVYKNL